jgi:hypothetical protein
MVCTENFCKYKTAITSIEYAQWRSCIYAVTPWRAHRQFKKKLGNIMFKNELFIATFNSLINSKSVQLIYR